MEGQLDTLNRFYAIFLKVTAQESDCVDCVFTTHNVTGEKRFNHKTIDGNIACLDSDIMVSYIADINNNRRSKP